MSSAVPAQLRAARSGSAAPRAVRPRPGVCSGTLAAARRSTVESVGSPRRSSSRVPKQVADGRPELHPAGRGGDHVDAVARPRVGDVGDARLQVLVLACAASAQPSTTRNTSPNGSSATVARGAQPPVRGHRVDAELGEALLAVGEQGRDLGDRAADRRRRRAGRRRRRRAAGRAARASAAAAEVEAVELHLRRRVGQRQARRSACAARWSCRSAAPPTTATWPAAPARASHSRSRRCSNGRSTTATGTCSAPCSSGLADGQAAAGSDRRPGRAARRASTATAPAAAARPGAPAGPGRRAGRPARRAGSRPAGSTRPPRPGRLGRWRRGTSVRERQHPAPTVGAGPAPAPAAVRPGDVGGLEPRQRLGVGLQVAVARGAGQLVRVRHAEHRAATPSAENVRSPIRYDRWVSSPRSRPSSSRCEASSRCTPSDRPSRPIWTNRSMKSGLADSSSLNSSQTIEQDGQRRQRRARPRGPARSRAARRSCRPRAAAPGGGSARR